METGNCPAFNNQITAMYKSLHINPFTQKVTTHVSKNAKRFVESSINSSVNSLSKKLTEEDINQLKRELFELNIPCENIEDQLAGMKRKRNNLGCLNFDIAGGNKFRKSNSAIFIASTASGKTVAMLNLLFEIINPFNQIVYFGPKSSAENEHIMNFKEYCKRVKGADGKQLMWFFHFNTDGDKEINFSNKDIDEYVKTELKSDGTVSSVYASPYGSVFIFDDLQNKGINSPVYKLMEECSIAGRHKLINWMAAFQSAIRLNSKLMDNVEKLFISKNLIEREDIWKKLHRPPPSNIQECVQDPDPPRFYIMQDDLLVPYSNLYFNTLSEVITKLKSKLPACILDEERKKKYLEKKRMIDEYEKQAKAAELNKKSFKPEDVKEQKADEVKVAETGGSTAISRLSSSMGSSALNNILNRQSANAKKLQLI